MTQVAGSIVTIDLNTAPTAQEALAQYDRERGLEPRIVMPTYNTMMTERRIMSSRVSAKPRTTGKWPWSSRSTYVSIVLAFWL